MHDAVYLLSACSILPAGLAACFRFAVVEKAFHPPLYLFLLGGINEVAGILLQHFGRTTTVNNNIYVLAEALLILWFFSNMRLFTPHSRALQTLFWLVPTLWVTEVVWIGIQRIGSVFRVLTAFAIGLLSVWQISRLPIAGWSQQATYAVLITCAAFTVFFTYKVLAEIFWAYGLGGSTFFRVKIYFVMVYVNIATNTLYTLAVLWMPRKPGSMPL